MDCKNSNDLISIIIPVYNVEQYLPKCLDSIINQTYKNLEIILIDDGSTDRSGEICDKYKNEDKRIMVIHQLNGGVSGARNTGIEVAKGKYILFIDSDDWIEKDYVSSLFTYAGDDTIVCCGYKRVFEDKIIEHSVKKLAELNKVEFLNLLQDYELEKHKKPVVNPIGNYMCNKIYPAQLFRSIRFPIGHVYEDAYISIRLFSQISKFIVLPEAGYNYVVRNDSIVATPKKLADIDYIMARLQQEQDLSLNNVLLLKAFVLTVYAVVNCYHHYCNGFYRLTDEEIIKLKEIVRARSCYIPSSHYKLLIKTFLILHAEIVLKAIYKTKKLLK